MLQGIAMPVLEISDLKKAFLTPDGKRHVVNVGRFSWQQAQVALRASSQDHLPQPDRRHLNRTQAALRGRPAMSALNESARPAARHRVTRTTSSRSNCCGESVSLNT